MKRTNGLKMLLCIVFLLPVIVSSKKQIFASACPYKSCTDWGCCWDENSEPNCNLEDCQWLTAARDCCKVLRCNCGTAADRCMRGSVHYSNCTDLCDELGKDCPSTCIPSGCSCGSYATSNQGHGSKTVTCKDGCGGTASKKCYCKTACTPKACPKGTSTTGTHGLYKKYTCTNDCGIGNSRTCNCTTACVPPACGDNRVETKQSGVLYGDNDLQDCQNDCNERQERNCYWVCERVTCADLPSQLGEGAWLDNCPAGHDCNVTTRDVEIENVYPGCIDKETLTCYYPNNRPETLDVYAVPGDFPLSSRNNTSPPPLLSKLISKVSAQTTDFISEFTSDTHGGKSLNNPVKIEATYSDTDGSDDIMALYVWFSRENKKESFITPTELNTTTGKTADDQNFGVMISRSYSSNNWNNAQVYIPRIEGGNGSWTEAVNINEISIIKGPTEGSMIKIYDIDITESGNNVYLNMIMRFMHEDDYGPNIETVETRSYNLWGSVNDKAGYLPFPDYPDANEIVDSADKYWVDPKNDWYVDILDPEAEITESVVDSYHEQVTVSIRAEDSHDGNPSGLSYVRLDACKAGEDAILPLTYDNSGNGVPEPISTYMPIDCDDVPGEGFEISDMTTGTSLLGTRGGFPNNPLDSPDITESAVIGLGGNKEGSITFYVTVMDMAGNTNVDDQTYLLEQWAVVEDALVFGKEGAISMTRTVTEPANILSFLRYPTQYDFTNQALLGQSASLDFGLEDLINTLANHSFKATGYPGQSMDSTSAFGELRDTYGNKSNNPNFEEQRLDQGNVISGTLTDPYNDPSTTCTKEYCIWIWEATDTVDTLTINPGFECNGKGLIMVNGNVDITPDFTTDVGPESACIILANGNITIKTTGAGNQANPGYDKIDAFLIANGYIEIEKVTTEDPPNDKGLFVQGGLVGFEIESGTNSSVLNRREIYYANMGRYPVLVVQGSSRYGILGRTLFGSQIDIYRSLQGFKPY